MYENRSAPSGIVFGPRDMSGFIYPLTFTLNEVVGKGVIIDRHHPVWMRVEHGLQHHQRFADVSGNDDHLAD